MPTFINKPRNKLQLYSLRHRYNLPYHLEDVCNMLNHKSLKSALYRTVVHLFFHLSTVSCEHMRGLDKCADVC